MSIETLSLLNSYDIFGNANLLAIMPIINSRYSRFNVEIYVEHIFF